MRLPDRLPRRSADAPGKLLLFGEHAAVYGHPALGVALPSKLTLSLEPCDTWHISLDDEAPAAAVTIDDALPVPGFTDHLQTTLSAAWGAVAPARIVIRTELPIGSGFGSSAALCVALTRAWAPDGTDAETIWRVAHAMERFFHGTPSGIDTGLAALGGVQEFRLGGPDSLPHARPRPLPAAVLAVGALPRGHSTRELVAMVRRSRQTDPATTDRHLHRLGELASEASACADAASLGALADEAQHRLATLGLSTPELDDALAAARRAGASGAKLSGAGGGGAFYAVCRDTTGADAVLAAWGEAGRFTLTIGG